MKNSFLYAVTIVAIFMSAFTSCSKDDTVSVEGVTLNYTNADDVKLIAGQSIDLVATVTPPNATNQKITWTSVPESVATVDQNGRVTAVNKGTATITATTQSGNKMATCAITVSPAVEGVTLNHTAVVLIPGDGLNLVATVTPVDPAIQSITWSSSIASVATVDQTGRVTAVSTGTATITATTQNGNKTATCTITVTTMQMILISEEPLDLETEIELAGTGYVTIDWGDGTEKATYAFDTDVEFTTYTHIYNGTPKRTITITGENVTRLECVGDKINNINRNDLTSLDLRKNPMLTYLNCGTNLLEDLDLSENKALTILSCRDNQISSLDLSECIDLTDLRCHRNYLTSLDMSNNTKLKTLLCYRNNLDVDELNDLFSSLHNNPVEDGKTIDISGNPGVEECDIEIAEGKGWDVITELSEDDMN